MQAPKTDTAAAKIENKIIPAQMVIGALISAAVFYAFILRVLTVKADYDQTVLFGAMAVMAGLAGIFVPIVMMNSMLAARKPTDDESTLFNSWFTCVIIRGALFEAVAVMGFVVAMSTSADKYYPFLAASVLLQVAFFPTVERFHTLKKTAGRVLAAKSSGR